jgi:hypothetical protein
LCDYKLVAFLFLYVEFFCELQLCTQVLIYQKYQKKNAFVIFIVKNFVCCFGNPWLIVLNKLSLFEGENHYFLSPLNFHLLYLKMSFMTEVNKLSNNWSKYWFVYAKKDGKSCQINYVTFLQNFFVWVFPFVFAFHAGYISSEENHPNDDLNFKHLTNPSFSQVEISTTN